MSEGKISLVNCDFKNKKSRINSPHSLMAFLLIGVTEEELKYIPKEEYIKNNIDNRDLEKELQEERYKHFENNRQQLIELAKKRRESLIRSEREKNVLVLIIVFLMIIKVIIMAIIKIIECQEII